MGITDETHKPGRQVIHPAERIMDVSRTISVERVHGKVATRRIQRPVIRIGNGGMATIGFHIDAQCRDLVGAPPGLGTDRAMVRADCVIADSGGIQTTHHLFGRMDCCDIHIRHLTPEHGIAHTAAHEQRGGCVRHGEHGQNLLCAGIGHPGLQGYGGSGRHLVATQLCESSASVPFVLSELRRG